jgi:gamma-glutamyltranspeptidase/glutathione hydrolase
MDGKRPTIAALHGMVAAAHPLAAQAGAKLLAAGGNAFDAAAAIAAALAVVEPFLSGPAGAGVAICAIAAEQRVRVLDFVPRRPPAGSGGALVCGTPGSLAGWCELATAHGRKKLYDIFAPAIALARDGHALAGFAAAGMNGAIPALQDKPFFADWRSAYLGHGSVTPDAGGLLRQPDLARIFEVIASEGPEHFYRGALGRKIVAHVQSLGGGLTTQDMAAFSPAWVEPLEAAYRGLLVHTNPGAGDALALALRILDGFDLAAMERGGAEQLDTVWRAIRLAGRTRRWQRCAPGCAMRSRWRRRGLTRRCSAPASRWRIARAMRSASARASAGCSAAAWWCRAPASA